MTDSRQRKGWTIRLGLSTRVNLLIYTLIAAMLLVYVPTVRSYMSLRQVFAEKFDIALRGWLPTATR